VIGVAVLFLGGVAVLLAGGILLAVYDHRRA